MKEYEICGTVTKVGGAERREEPSDFKLDLIEKL
jgi:hypothetical protein